MGGRKEHWERVYEVKDAPERSWFQGRPETSLSLIDAADLSPAARVLDVGGGTARLVDELLARGFSDLAVLDISGAALVEAQRRLGESARGAVTWIEADILEADLPAPFDLWHDRAVFHFLTDEREQRRYVDALRASLAPNGYVILATFAEDGPSMCSGLPVQRYSPSELHAQLGAEFSLLQTVREPHETPGKAIQSFVYALFRRGA